MGLNQSKPLLKENSATRSSFSEGADKSPYDWIPGDSFRLSKFSDENIFGGSKNEGFSQHCKNQPTSYPNMGNIQHANNPDVRNVIDTIKNGEKILIIMRGLPGSGKSTLAHHLIKSSVAAFKEKLIFSADDLFVDPITNEYHFNRLFLHRAHSQNIRKVLNAAKRNVTPLIIDNTNLTLSEMLPYAGIAAKYNYTVKFLEPCTPWRYNRRECAKRNVHGVQDDHIHNMMKRFDRSLTEADLFSLPSKIITVNNHQKKKRIEHANDLEFDSNGMHLLKYAPEIKLILPHFSSSNELRTLMREFFLILQKFYTSKHSDVANSLVFHKEEEQALKNICLLQDYNKSKQNFRKLQPNRDTWLKADGVVIQYATRTISFPEIFKLVYAIYCILHANIENGASASSQTNLTVFSDQGLLRKLFLPLLVIIGSRTTDAGHRVEEEDKCKYEQNFRNNYAITENETKSIDHSGCNISPAVFSHALNSLSLTVSTDNDGGKGYEEDKDGISNEKYTDIYSSESITAKNTGMGDENYLINFTKDDNGNPDMWDLNNGVSWGSEETATEEVRLCQADCLPPKPPRPNRKPRVSQYSWEVYSPELLLPKPPRPNRKPRVTLYSWEEYAPDLEVKSGALPQEFEKWVAVEDPLSSWESEQTRKCISDTGRRLRVEEHVFPLPENNVNINLVLECNDSLHCDGRHMQEVVSKPQRARRNRNH